MFLAVWTGLLLISGLIGWGVFFVSRRFRRRWLTGVTGVASAFVLLIASAFVYVLIGDATPATNERVGSEQRFVVEIRGDDPTRKLVDQLFPPTNEIVTRESFNDPPSLPRGSVNKPVNAGERLPVLGNVEVRAPSKVTPREDFSLALSITSNRIPQPVDVVAVRMSAPRSAELRTLDVCPSPHENPPSACSTPVKNRFQVAWDVTPTEAGQLLFTIGLPSDLMPQSGVEKWEATSVGGWGSGGRGESPVMTPSSPALTSRGVSIDLHSGQLRVPVEVVSTLGVNRSVYNGLAFIGTLLSAFLGSGWLWKLLEWRRTRAATTRKISYAKY